MKKILTVLLILAVAAGGLFAQEEGGSSITGGPDIKDAKIVISGSGDATFIPFQVYDTDADASKGTAGGNASSIGVSVEGQGNEKVGFKVEFKGDNKTAGIGDWAYLWVKPIEQIKFSAGRFNGDTLRGKVGDGGYGDYTLEAGGGEDNIFSRFQPGPDGIGLLLDVTPIEGLYLGAMLQDLSGKGLTKGVASNKVEDVIQKIQVALGYEIPNVGLARVQFIGNTGDFTEPKSHWKLEESASGSSYGYVADTDADNADNGTWAPRRIEAAFAYTGLEGLTLDLGGKYYLPIEHEDPVFMGGSTPVIITHQEPVVVALGAKFVSGDLTITGRVDTKIGGSEKIDMDVPGQTGSIELKSGFGLNFRVTPEYKLGDTVSVSANIGFELTPEMTSSESGAAIGGLAMLATSGTKIKADAEVNFGAGLFGKLTLGNGSIESGLAFQVPTDGNGKTFKFSIPVIVAYSF